MRLTVLGSAASYAGIGRACSGYLVESGGTRLLLDCGHGALANLAGVCDPSTLDAVFITHAHPDHMVDLYAFQALLRYAPDGPMLPVRLHGPKGLVDTMSCLLSDRGAMELKEAFEESWLTDGAETAVGAFTVRSVGVEHMGETYALVVTDPDGSCLCYSSDTRACPALLEAARGADVLLAEATLPEAYVGCAPHMTAREAASVAGEAGVATLVLTHVWPATDRDAILEEAEDVFHGTVLVAEESMVITVG